MSRLKNVGIYKIKNKKNGKCYIGESFNLRERQRIHFSSLRSGTHFIKQMIEDFQLYGEDAFKFTVLEYIADNEYESTHAAFIDMLLKEKEYIKNHEPSLLYNTLHKKKEANKSKIQKQIYPMTAFYPRFIAVTKHRKAAYVAIIHRRNHRTTDRGGISNRRYGLRSNGGYTGFNAN